MLTTNDIKIITEIVNSEINKAITKAVAPLALASEMNQGFAKIDTRLTKLEVKTDANFTQLKNKIDKSTEKLEKAITKEHKIGRDILTIAQKENFKTLERVEKIEHHFGFTPAFG